MSSGVGPSVSTPPNKGLPPGSVEAVASILAGQRGPMRRRKLLEALDQQGHRISLAGLNRVLQHCQESGLTVEGPAGVALSKRPASGP
jgi:hypothetical protein